MGKLTKYHAIGWNQIVLIENLVKLKSPHMKNQGSYHEEELQSH